MRLSRWACLPLVLSVALFSASCSDDGESTGGGGSSGAGTNSSAGSSAAGASSLAGSSSSGASSGGSGGASSAGASNVSGSGGAAGGGGGRIYTARPDFCTPHCEDSGGYCALIDKGGCSGARSCVLEAECRPYTACAVASDQNCGPGKCIDNTEDTCAMVGCAGHCVCNVKACPDGQAFDENAAVCACVPAVSPPLDCGDIDCPDGTDCEAVLESAVCVKRFAR